MIDPRECPNRSNHMNEACSQCGLIMDYPAGFAFVRTTDMNEHHERCSWRAGMLCDCDVLNKEYARRKATIEDG